MFDLVLGLVVSMGIFVFLVVTLSRPGNL